ncbi:Subtilase family protein [Tardiphaga sp. OK245]|nr:Subtilase family protein [Tardiphaga sp. OK245]
MGDVWAAFAADPGVSQDLLITPHRQATAAKVASRISKALQRIKPNARAKIAYLQGIVGAKFYFDEVLRVLVPVTQWWFQPQLWERIGEVDPGRLANLLTECAAKPKLSRIPVPDPNYTSLERYIALAGLIYWVSSLSRPHQREAPELPVEKLPMTEIDDAFIRYSPHISEIVSGMFALYRTVQDDSKIMEGKLPPDSDDDDVELPGLIFQVSLNRIASPALDRSLPAVKADAVHSLFKVNCKNMIWAVLDSGIDSTHDAFMTVKGKPNEGAAPQFVSRIVKTLDFSKIREIVSNNESDLDGTERVALAQAAGLTIDDTRKYLSLIATDADEERPVNWAIVEKLITLKNPENSKPNSSHGTHVAGIIGADRHGNGRDSQHAGGMCPDIRFYDLRVLGKTMQDTEFAIIAALQYIRYVNERHSNITIHGANLSLSIPHNVRNYACGRTPVCNECERLVESGVVVVAAAGNHGFQKFETKDGIFENYAAFSITDPGNGDGVITVGSTHGNWPHTYGVSFFSSRGPTGDGRMKPDLVAPGERVMSTILEGKWGPNSGTSMATPHVSGAAALLLARYDELVGQPRRVKRILCESATDLGRERSFQGHGMLDVLRAFQSI